MKKSIIMIFVFSLLSFVCILIVYLFSNRLSSNNKDSAATNDQQLVDIKFGYMPFTTNWPVFLAQKENIFGKNGLNVELVSFNSGVDAANAVISNQISAHAVNTFVDLFNIEGRSPNKIKLFAVQQLSNDGYSEALVARKNSGINSIKDLKGKKVGITPGTFTETIVTAAYGKEINLKEEAELVKLAPNLQVPALESGQIDALFAYEPNITLTTTNDTAYIVDDHFFRNVAEPFYLGGFTISQQLIENNPDVAKRIIKSIDEAMQLGEENPKLKYEAIASFTALDPSIIEKLKFSKNIMATNIDSEDLKKTSELYKELKLFDGDIRAESMIYSF
jgi:ABC-type nitrate/sulfonate/bicarbonate transport system substrate-binding protein